MKRSRIILATFGLCGLFCAMIAAQAPEPTDVAPVEKRIVELAKKIATLQEELKRLQRELNEKSPITLFPVKIIDPREAVKILEDVCGDGTPGLLLEALPKLKCVAVRANKELTSGIAKLILELDVELPQHPRSFGPSREIPDSLKLPVSGIWGFPREPVPLPKKP